MVNMTRNSTASPLNATTRHISSQEEKKTISLRKKIENWREDLSIKISFKFWKISGIVPTSDTTVINNVCVYT